jgi:hypothetical protein
MLIDLSEGWVRKDHQDAGWVQLLAAPQPQVFGRKAQVPKGLPGRLQLMPKQQLMSTQLLALDGDAQHRHLRHTSNGSNGAAASVIAAGDMDPYTTLRTGTYDSSPPPPLLAPPAC